MKYFAFLVFFLLSFLLSFSQPPQDSTLLIGKTIITLKEVVVDSRLNVPSFIDRIKNDSSFYKAFRNLRTLEYTAINDIRMVDKSNDLIASLWSRTQQHRNNGCRTMETLEEKTTGDIYDKSHEFNYYTADMYASLFFTKGSICGETNIVGGREFSTSGKSGMEKHKEQLKMLFFNPGKKINGIPFISGKTGIYDEEMADYYDMSIDMDLYNKINCYVFRQKVKPGKESNVVIDEMTTWFDDSTFEIVARDYSLSYDAGVYDFQVNMEVQMTHFNQLLVPALIRYTGNWKAIFKKRERGVFTATLFDFK